MSMFYRFLNEADGQSTAEKERNAEKNITFYYCHVANDVSSYKAKLQKAKIPLEINQYFFSV